MTSSGSATNPSALHPIWQAGPWSDIGVRGEAVSYGSEAVDTPRDVGVDTYVGQTAPNVGALAGRGERFMKLEREIALPKLAPSDREFLRSVRDDNVHNLIKREALSFVIAPGWSRRHPQSRERFL